MTNGIGLGHAEAHEKLTARLFYKLNSQSGYSDAGNVMNYTDVTSRSLVTRARASAGARHVNDEQPDVNHEAWEFELDERVPSQEKLIRLANQNTDATQAVAEGSTAVLTLVTQGLWYMIGVYNLVNVQVSVSPNAWIAAEGDDYQLDKPNGRILVLATGNIPNGATLTVSFDAPTITFEKYTSQQTSLFYGQIVIEEYNQFNAMFLRRLTFHGTLNITAFPAQTGPFGVYKCKCTPSEPVDIRKRGEAQTLPTHPATTEAAGYSSSSTSSHSDSQTGSSKSSSSVQ